MVKNVYYFKYDLNSNHLNLVAVKTLLPLIIQKEKKKIDTLELISEVNT